MTGVEVAEPAQNFAEEIAALCGLDPRFHPIAAAAGSLPARPGRPGFEGLASTVVAQLVSRQSAEAIWRRLVHATGPFSPASYLAVARGEGPRLGLTAAKADTLVRIAEAIVSGQLDLDAVARMPAERAVTTLMALKGIGQWTAEVHLLFNAGHRDIFPAGDLALRIAAGQALPLGEKPDASLLRSVSAGWAPHRSVAARLLWAYYGRIIRPGGAILP